MRLCGHASYRIFYKQPSSQFVYHSIALYVFCTCCINLILLGLASLNLPFHTNIAYISNFGKVCIGHTNTITVVVVVAVVIIIIVIIVFTVLIIVVLLLRLASSLTDLLCQHFDSMRAVTPIIIMKNVRYKFLKLPSAVSANIKIPETQSEKCETQEKTYKQWRR